MMCSIVKVQGERGGGGKMRQIFPAPKRGQKSNGRGVQLRVPLSFVHRVSPSPLQYKYIRCGSRQGGSRGEAVSGPAPGPAGNAKAVPSAKDPTPPESFRA